MASSKKISLTKDWCISAAKWEAHSEISAGTLALTLSPEAFGAASQLEAAESPIVFSRFVQLMRRKRNLTLEGLALQADIELGELVAIERGIHHVPEPRTVYQLARFFGLPAKGLLQLSGLAKAKDARFEHEAIRFAARSESVDKLSSEEAAALEGFVAVLSTQR